MYVRRILTAGAACRVWGRTVFGRDEALPALCLCPLGVCRGLWGAPGLPRSPARPRRAGRAARARGPPRPGPAGVPVRRARGRAVRFRFVCSSVCVGGFRVYRNAVTDKCFAQMCTPTEWLIDPLPLPTPAQPKLERRESADTPQRPGETRERCAHARCPARPPR